MEHFVFIQPALAKSPNRMPNNPLTNSALALFLLPLSSLCLEENSYLGNHHAACLLSLLDIFLAKLMPKARMLVEISPDNLLANRHQKHIQWGNPILTIAFEARL
uniref:Uncharacterized protein n=1 Tax=Romanomermis culicivorax TaxID=13658 RepID=A0A915J652_ROMCU